MRAVAALAVGLSVAVGVASAKAPHVPAPRTDAARIIDLPPGFRYRVLATSGATPVVSTESGKTFAMPDDFDANVLVPVPGDARSQWLLSAHELTKPVAGDFQGDKGKPAVEEQAAGDDGDSDGWGAVSRLTLDAASGRVTKAELITTGLHDLCAGALTPWGTFLVNEEFPFRNDPEKRSGWVWEVDPATGKATKLVGMGRYSHEQEALVGDAWYLTDDFGTWRFTYRFVPDTPRDLTKGRLFGLRYDRSTNTGTWIGPLDPMDPHADMRARGIDPTVYGFDKAEGLVATPDGRSFVFSESGSKSNPTRTDNPGNVWLLTPQADGTVKGGILVEGDFNAVSHPDNVRFTPGGDLLILEDNGSSVANANGGVNEVRLLPKGFSGRTNTVVLARMPDGEPTGPWFAADGKTMMLASQDNGGKSYALAVTWPRPFTKPYAPYWPKR